MSLYTYSAASKGMFPCPLMSKYYVVVAGKMMEVATSE